jgi:hypothetical protein
LSNLAFKDRQQPNSEGKYENKYDTSYIHPYLICLHPYLSIFGSQEEARRCKDNTSQTSKNVHVIEENQEEPKGVAGGEALRQAKG